MTSQMFVDAAAFSASSVVFNPPKLNKAGGKNVTLTNKDTRKQLALSTPLMLTWGMNEFRDEATGRSPTICRFSSLPMDIPTQRLLTSWRSWSRWSGCARPRPPRRPRIGSTNLP
jgi:hypothetical protein